LIKAKLVFQIECVVLFADAFRQTLGTKKEDEQELDGARFHDRSGHDPGHLVLIPLIYTEALPKAMLSTLLIAPPPPPPPPPPPAPVKTIIKPVARLIQSGKLVAAARESRRKWAVSRKLSFPPDVINNTNNGGVFRRYLPGRALCSLDLCGHRLRRSRRARPAIKQGGNVTAASIVTQTRPLYPALARQARIQGNVVLHAIIDKDGKVAQLEVISGPPVAGSGGSGRRETMAL